MVSSSYLSIIICCIVIFGGIFVSLDAHLTPVFYDKVCPEAIPTIKDMIEKAIKKEPRMGASLLRLHFHDCFVNGCDGSVLLADTANFTGERTAFPNNNSIRGFEIVDEIKAAVNSACGRNVVSCADILAVAARDSVALLGGPSYKVMLGRKDAVNASWMDANTNLPAPFLNLTGLLASFNSKGLNLQDLVVLSAAHTLGEAQCASFRGRIYGDKNIDPTFAADLKTLCPPVGGDNTTVGLDGSPFNFDNAYFNNLLAQQGLLHSDQELFKHNSSASDFLVRKYSNSRKAFMSDFGESMIKMGNLKPAPGAKSEIRMNCSRINIH